MKLAQTRDPYFVLVRGKYLVEELPHFSIKIRLAFRDVLCRVKVSESDNITSLTSHEFLNL